jgi:hypothetical protein
MKKILYIALVALCVVACTPPDVDQTKLFLTEDQAQDLIAKGTLLDLNQLKDTSYGYMSEEGNYCLPELYRERSKAGSYYLFSIDTIPANDENPLYIRGRITTDDYAGNFYKTLCIQQVFVNGSDTTQQALRLSVDLGSANGMYQIGQEILIRVDGLAIGRYANQPQLCLPSYNNNTHANKAEEKVGWAAGRIPAAIFKARTHCIGMPDKSQLYYETLKITDYNNILDLEDARSWDAKLVCIKNVHFTGQYYNNGTPAKCTTGDPETDQNANVFAPTTNNLNFPQARVFYDENNNHSAVSTSEYAKYAHFYLPADKYKGDVVGILGFYYDNGLKYSQYPPAKDDWSISIRSVDDLRLYDGDEHWLYDENGDYKPGYEYSKK